MHWKKRIQQWKAALEIARRTHGKNPWLTMFLALLTGVVSAPVWRNRIRRCYTCPLFSKDGYRCRGAVKPFSQWGCDCYIPFSALTAEPYKGGCYGRAKFGGDFGWGEDYSSSRWARTVATTRILLSLTWAYIRS